MMILHDKVTIVVREDTGETDAHGNPIYEDVEYASPAEVQPLRTEDAGAHSDVVITRFRVVLPPSAAPMVGTDALTWRGDSYEVEGTTEPHTVKGRLHHYELLVRKAG